MRHAYAGDIGDYIKYALLRSLCQATRRRLGVIWYLTDHPENTRDGRLRHHLVQDGWDTLDPELLAELRRLYRADALSVDTIERSAVLPSGTVFHTEPMPEGSSPARLRAERRAEWFKRARTAVEGCGLVFLDPDNGLALASIRPERKDAGKYATATEVATILATGTGVVLYQHRDRRPWPAQRASVLSRLAEAYPRAPSVQVVRFGSRTFWCLSPAPALTRGLHDGIEALHDRVASGRKSWHLEPEIIELGAAGAEQVSLTPLWQRFLPSEHRGNVGPEVPR